jgi:hypothetical protein
MRPGALSPEGSGEPVDGCRLRPRRSVLRRCSLSPPRTSPLGSLPAPACCSATSAMRQPRSQPRRSDPRCVGSQPGIPIKTRWWCPNPLRGGAAEDHSDDDAARFELATTALANALPARPVEAMGRYAWQARADSTWRAYEADNKHFAGWCAANALVASLGDRPIDVRDRALLLIGFTGASQSASKSPTAPKTTTAWPSCCAGPRPTRRARPRRSAFPTAPTRRRAPCGPGGRPPPSSRAPLSGPSPVMAGSPPSDSATGPAPT